MLNTHDIIVALHKKYSPCDAAYNLVFTHCCIVRDIAIQLIDTNSLNVDRNLVEAGALLHDIGAYSFFDTSGKLQEDLQYIAHGIEGEHILKKEGLPEVSKNE